MDYTVSQSKLHALNARGATPNDDEEGSNADTDISMDTPVDDDFVPDVIPSTSPVEGTPLSPSSANAPGPAPSAPAINFVQLAKNHDRAGALLNALSKLKLGMPPSLTRESLDVDIHTYPTYVKTLEPMDVILANLRHLDHKNASETARNTRASGHPTASVTEENQNWLDACVKGAMRQRLLYGVPLSELFGQLIEILGGHTKGPQKTWNQFVGLRPPPPGTDNNAWQKELATTFKEVKDSLNEFEETKDIWFAVEGAIAELSTHAAQLKKSKSKAKSSDDPAQLAKAYDTERHQLFNKFMLQMFDVGRILAAHDIVFGMSIACVAPNDEMIFARSLDNDVAVTAFRDTCVAPGADKEARELQTFVKSQRVVERHVALRGTLNDMGVAGAHLGPVGTYMPLPTGYDALPMPPAFLETHEDDDAASRTKAVPDAEGRAEAGARKLLKRTVTFRLDTEESEQDEDGVRGAVGDVDAERSRRGLRSSDHPARATSTTPAPEHGVPALDAAGARDRRRRIGPQDHLHPWFRLPDSLDEGDKFADREMYQRSFEDLWELNRDWRRTTLVNEIVNILKCNQCMPSEATGAKLNDWIVTGPIRQRMAWHGYPLRSNKPPRGPTLTAEGEYLKIGSATEWAVTIMLWAVYRGYMALRPLGEGESYGGDQPATVVYGWTEPEPESPEDYVGVETKLTYWDAKDDTCAKVKREIGYVERTQAGFKCAPVAPKNGVIWRAGSYKLGPGHGGDGAAGGGGVKRKGETESAGDDRRAKRTKGGEEVGRSATPAAQTDVATAPAVSAGEPVAPPKTVVPTAPIERAKPIEASTPMVAPQPVPLAKPTTPNVITDPAHSGVPAFQTSTPAQPITPERRTPIAPSTGSTPAFVRRLADAEDVSFSGLGEGEVMRALEYLRREEEKAEEAARKAAEEEAARKVAEEEAARKAAEEAAAKRAELEQQLRELAAKRKARLAQQAPA